MAVEIIGASTLLVCDEHFSVMSRGGVAFLEGKILAVGDFERLCQDYGVSGEFFEDGVLLPAFINAHTHIEYSANVAYNFGSFSRWLSSVMSQRECNVATQAQMQHAIQALHKGGVGSIGAISSFGADLKALADSSLRVLYFCELLGSDEQKAPEAFEGFLSRIAAAQSCINDRFSVGVGIHSPYSVSPTLLKQAITFANEHTMPVSVHFLESREEYEWLESSSGFFKDFYASFNPNNTKSFYTIESFLSHFNALKGNILFVHGTQASEKEWQRMAELGGALVSCPRSNRLLDGKMLDYARVSQKMPCVIGTDSLASNASLSMLDELRAALFAFNAPLESLAQALLLSVTQKAGSLLGLGCGVLKKDYHADMVVFEIPHRKVQDALSVILHAQEARALWVAGKKIL